ncbi:hypothetical protein H0X09_03155 [Candidatus Saccharibacteria bacterium]|nr:hypothetical protein [Candidatus Saccharibacteria bacterium]
MSEMLPSGESGLKITEEDAIASPKLRAEYLSERITLVKSGTPVWILRNFDGPSDMESGVIVDFYAAGVQRGYIEGNDLDGYQVYGPAIEELGDGPVHLNMEPVDNRSEAERILRDYVYEALLKWGQGL